MRALVVCSYLIALLVHATFGCCAHHSCANDAAAAHSHHDARETCGHQTAEGDQGDTPASKRECDKSLCSYTWQRSVRYESFVAGDFLPITSAITPFDAGVDSRMTQERTTSFILPLRAHLYHQILLI